MPVLSLQISFAPPIVSLACNLFTKLFSLNIFWTLNASEIVTARGKPSGTATTIIVTAIMKKFKICIAEAQVRKAAVPENIVEIIRRMSKAAKVRIATYKPTIPI